MGDTEDGAMLEETERVPVGSGISSGKIELSSLLKKSSTLDSNGDDVD
jgi:hypothetical protein